MIDLDFTFSCDIELMQTEKTAWHMAILPQNIAADIKAFTKHKKRRGFGSLKVEAKIGKTEWNTSIFPSNSHNSYLMPIKKSVRIAENIGGGEPVQINLRVLTQL